MNNPLLQNDHCEFNPSWNTAICTNRYGHFFVDNRDKTPQPMGPVSITRESATSPVLPYRVFGSPTNAGKPATSFQTNLIIGDTYQIALGQQTTHIYRIALRDCEPGDWVIVGVEADTSIVVRERTHLLPEVFTQAALEKADKPTIFRDGSRVYVKLITTPRTARTGAAVLISHAPTAAKGSTY